MKKKLLAAMMALTLTVGMMPAAVQAEENTGDHPVMAELYVSPNGSANAQGTKDDPLDSMESAKAKVATMNQNMTGDIVVYFEDGEYLVTDTVAFTTADSGTNGYKVVYKAAGGAQPVLTGGVHVTGWSDAGDENRPGMMVADVDINNTRQLYVDGQMATRAKGSIPGNMQRDGEKTVYTTYNGDHDAYTGFSVDNTEIQNWRNPGDIEFVWDISWAHRIAKVESITPMEGDANKSFITMRWDTFKTGQIAGGVQITGAPNYVENAYELLDEPGEWYFDRAEKKLYYMPTAGQDINAADVIIPGVENIITVTGEHDQKAGNLTFEGLSFEYNTWLTPSEMGWPEQQANFAHDPKEDFNMHAYSLAPGAAIETKYAQNVTFDGCTFQNLGSAAINILEGSVGNTVSNSVFKSLSAGGVMVGGASIDDAHPLAEGDTIENHIANGTPHDEAQIVKDNTITNNYFNGIGTEYKGSIAVVAGYTDGTVITNNTIRDVAYSGISVGWGWGFWDQDGRYIDDKPDNETPAEYPRFPEGDAAASQNNVISNNDISECMMKLHDGAGIYTLGDMPGSLIEGNLIHDNAGWPGGIYLDEGSGGMTVKDNITYNTQIALNDNVRDHTWGYRNDRPVYSNDTNYFNVSPDMDNYPADIAANAGVTDKDLIPKELNSVTAPEFVESGDKILLEGNFGEEPGKVVLTGADGNVEVTQESGNLLSWTEKQILFRMPGGVTSGVIYVETADGVQTNKNHRLTVGDFTDVLFKDDFDDYETGALLGQALAEETYTEISDRATIEETEDGSKVLKLTTNGSDTILAKADTWRDAIVSVDFKFDSDPQSWYRTLGVSPRYQNNDNKVEAAFTSYSQGILLDQRVNGNLSRAEAKSSYQTGVWYSAKVAMVGNELKVKVWEKGKPEPSLWTGSASHSEIKYGGVLLYFTDADRNDENTSSVELDNLRVLQYADGVTSDLSADKTAPVITAEVSGSQAEKNVYNSEVSVSLNAQDSESEIADVEYSLNGGSFTDYSEPLKFTKNGDYEIVFRATDRAGNVSIEKKIQFTIALKEADQVLFEDDFEGYTTGAFEEQKGEYTLDNGQCIEIVEDENGNKTLRLTSPEFEKDVNVMRTGAWDTSDTIMTLDLMYSDSPYQYGGPSVSNYFQSNSDKYQYVFARNWGGVLFQKKINGSADNFTKLSNDQFTVEPGTWYHVKVQTSPNLMALKVWSMDEQEPEEWMAQGELSGLQVAGGLELSFMDEKDHYVEFDNVKVLGFGGAESDTTSVRFQTEPEETEVTVTNADGTAVKAEEDGSYQLSQGTYQYQISAEGYQDVTGTLEIQGESGKTVYVTLIKEKEVTDRTELDQVIEEALAIENLESYTDESAELFRTALADALKLDENATQDDIDNAVKALQDAIAGLTLKSNDNPGGNQGEDNPGGNQGGDNQGGNQGGDNQGGNQGGNNQGGNQGGNNQGGNNQSGNGSTGNGSAAQNNTVKTGDTMNWIPVVGMAAAVAAILAVVVVRRKRR